MKKSMRRSVRSFGLLWLFLVSVISGGLHQPPQVRAQYENQRDIISEDFLKHRPRRSRTGKPPKRPWDTYRPASPATKQFDRSRLQIGLTIWRLEPITTRSAVDPRAVYDGDRNKMQWIPRRVEADTQFHEGDSLRLSIESPRAGYLYVVDRDQLADGSDGETNLIFPTQGEDNRLEPGKLIDVPAQGDAPFKTSPKQSQVGELLTFIFTSFPLPLRLSSRPLPISKAQLTEWEEKWSGETERFEMNGGVGRARTKAEQLAASPSGIRQLTREDPLPQTIYSLRPKNTNAFLFNLVLSYAK